jgi:hypothetical protein
MDGSATFAMHHSALLRLRSGATITVLPLSFTVAPLSLYHGLTSRLRLPTLDFVTMKGLNRPSAKTLLSGTAIIEAIADQRIDAYEAWQQVSGIFQANVGMGLPELKEFVQLEGIHPKFNNIGQRRTKCIVSW